MYGLNVVILQQINLSPIRMEFIVDYIKNYYPTIGIILGIIIATYFVSWRLFKFYNRVVEVEKECKSISGITVTLNDIQKTNHNISTSINGLVIFLKSKHSDMEPSLFQSKSPVQLTDFGMLIYDAYGCRKYVEDNKELLIYELEAKKPKTGIDVQNEASALLYKLNEDDSFTPIKKMLFSKPVFTSEKPKGEALLDLNTINTIMSIGIRNIYLEKHPEIKDE